MVFEQDLCSGMVSITPPFKGNHYPGHRSVGGAAPKGYRAQGNPKRFWISLLALPSGYHEWTEPFNHKQASDNDSDLFVTRIVLISRSYKFQL